MSVRPFEPKFMKLSVLTAALQELTPRSVRDGDPDQAVLDWLEFARELECPNIQLSAALHPSEADVPPEALLDPVANTLDLRAPFDKARASRVLAAMEAARIGITDIAYFDNLLHEDGGLRRKKHVFMLRVLDAAAALGVRAVCGFVGRNQSLSMDANLLQDWLVDPEFPRVWRLEKARAGSGSLGDILSHTMDLSRYLVGEPSEVSGLLKTFVHERPLPGGTDASRSGHASPAGRAGYAAVDVDDAAAALVRFESGAVGYYEGSRFAPGRKNHHRVEINGAKGSLVWDLERLNELELYTESSSRRNAGPTSGFRRISVTEPQHPYLAGWWPPGHIIGYEHSFTHTVYDLLCGLASGQSPSPNFEDGVQNQRVLDAITRPAGSGQWERVGAS